MKKVLSIFILAIFTIVASSCSVEDMKQKQETNLVSRDGRHQIVIDSDWEEINSAMIEYAESNNIPSRRFGPLCYTTGINFVLVRDFETEQIYKVTWQGGLSYSVEKIGLSSALDLCTKHKDWNHGLD